LVDQGDKITARDLIYFFIKTRSVRDYFFYRFSQPRYFVALSLISIFKKPAKPVLDLACGCGHITRALVHQAKDQQIVGIDRSFDKLYIAKHLIAPEAEYVCCDGDISLPFDDNAFSGVLCSDAFYFFANKVTSTRELKRLTGDTGIIVLTRLHNVLFRYPHDGLPLPVEGYQMLVNDMPHRMLADSSILERYLQKKGPPLAHSADVKQLSQEPLLSIVASRRQEIFEDYGPFEEWPHAQGQLKLNPIYREEERDKFGRIVLRRQLPLENFKAEELSEYDAYLPENVRIPSHTLTEIEKDLRTSEVQDLIKHFIVLGMPKKYY
jgi:ubiquinone/menaquinone biosynthesis C-methylase UbiE